MWGTMDQLFIVFSSINNCGRSHEYQQKFQNKQQEAALHITHTAGQKNFSPKSVMDGKTTYMCSQGDRTSAN